MSEQQYKLPEPLALEIADMPPFPPFEYMDDLLEWFSAEAEVWALLDAPFKKIAGGETAISALREARNAYDSARAWIKTRVNPNLQAEHRANLIRTMQRFAEGTAIYSQSPVGILIREMASRDPETAVGMVLAHTKNRQFMNDVTLAIVKGQIALAAGTGAVSLGWETALSDVGDRWTSQLETKVTAADNYNRQQRQNSRIIVRGLKRLARFQARRNETYNRILETHQTTMASMEKTFSEKMTLRAAERYWGSLRTVLTKRARYNLVAFTSLIVCGGATLAFYFWLIVDWLSWHTNASTTTALLLPGLALGLPTLMWIWAIRIASMRYQDNTHQADDAQARVAMLQSFIALEYKGKVSNEERLLVLEALFRPRAGASSNETLPNPIAAAVIRALERKALSATPTH